MPTRRELFSGLFDGRGVMPVQAATPSRRNGAEYFPNVSLTTHEGKTVKFYDDLIKGKVVALNMFYVRCKDTCPLTTANLVRLQELLGERVGRDVFMYSITLQPEVDSPSDLRKYVEAMKVKPGWLFLTGTPGDIRKVRDRLGFNDPDPKVDRNIFSHTGAMRIGNDNYDRWAMAPALAAPEHILSTINHVDRSRLKGEEI